MTVVVFEMRLEECGIHCSRGNQKEEECHQLVHQLAQKNDYPGHQRCYHPLQIREAKRGEKKGWGGW